MSRQAGRAQVGGQSRDHQLPAGDDYPLHGCRQAQVEHPPQNAAVQAIPVAQRNPYDAFFVEQSGDHEHAGDHGADGRAPRRAADAKARAPHVETAAEESHRAGPVDQQVVADDVDDVVDDVVDHGGGGVAGAADDAAAYEQEHLKDIHGADYAEVIG